MKPTKAERAAHGKVERERVHGLKVQVIGDRRAKALNLSRPQLVEGIIQGKYRPITAEDIAAEPAPEEEPSSR